MPLQRRKLEEVENSDLKMKKVKQQQPEIRELRWQDLDSQPGELKKKKK